MIKSVDYTVTQMLLAAGISRNIKRSTLVRTLNISESYYTKMMKNSDFTKLIGSFQSLELDNDELNYNGLGTLEKTVGKFLYNLGQKNENNR